MKKKIKLPAVKFNYKKIIAALQNKLRSGKLTEKQKIKVFFFIKAQEIKNMDSKDLLRAKKKYSKLLITIDRTISFLSARQQRSRSNRSISKLRERITLETYARKQCSSLLLKIERELLKL